MNEHYPLSGAHPAPAFYTTHQAIMLGFFNEQQGMQGNTHNNRDLNLHPVFFNSGVNMRTLNQYIQEQKERLGLEPIQLEKELLLKRIRDGGYSSAFLADAFHSMYRSNKTFEFSLSGLSRIDAEDFRLFHGIIHARHIEGWDDEFLYQTLCEIQDIMKEKKTAE